MTNYEWIVTNEKEITEVILTNYIAKEKGEVSLCNETCCSDCDFKSSLNDNQMCAKTTKEWLKAEHEPLYKKGDVVIDKDGVIWVVASVKDETLTVVSKTRYIPSELMVDIPESDITKKVGNIYDK